MSPSASMYPHPEKQTLPQDGHRMVDNKTRIRYKERWIAQKAVRSSVIKGETEIRVFHLHDRRPA